MADWWSEPLSPVTAIYEHIAVGPINAVAASNILTSNNTNVSNLDTVTVNGKIYTFKTTMTATEGEIKIGADADASLLNLARAINNSGGTPVTDYQVAAAHPTVSSSATVSGGHTITLSARTKGTAGNALTLAEVAVTLTITGALFTGGIDGTVARRGKGYEDGTYTYLAIANNTVADANWRRQALGAVY
jgi:hypothetical protein